MREKKIGESDSIRLSLYIYKILCYAFWILITSSAGHSICLRIEWLSMKRFELIEHTADTGLIAYGNNLAGAFANAAYGLFSIITAVNRINEVESIVVSIHSDDMEALLFDWLNHLIYIFDVEHLLFSRFDITEFTEKNLTATCWGEKFDTGRHQINTGVKSATYHMLKVDGKNNKVQVILDV